MQQEDPLTKRIKEVELEIAQREQEHAMLCRLSNILVRWKHIIREDDVFSERTATKYELLARVANYLSDPDQVLRGGAKTKEIYDWIIAEVELETEQSGVDPRPLNQRILERVTRLASTSNATINYNTFRSYLARFRDERRIFFNEKTKRWRVDPTEQVMKVEDVGGGYEPELKDW